MRRPTHHQHAGQHTRRISYVISLKSGQCVCRLLADGWLTVSQLLADCRPMRLRHVGDTSVGLDSLPLPPPSVKLSTLLFLLHDLQSDWILELANQNSTIIGVVGWVDLTDPQVNI